MKKSQVKQRLDCFLQDFDFLLDFLPGDIKSHAYINDIEKSILKEINNLESEGIYQEEFFANTRRLSKANILKLLGVISNLSVSNKVLVDIVLNEDNSNDINFVGRPNVTGSSYKQMRHVTPYSFAEQMIKVRLKDATSAKAILSSFSQNISVFMYGDKGICLRESEYTGQEEYDIKLVTKKQEEVSTYYLFSNKQGTKEEEVLYYDRKSKLYKSILETLISISKDENSLTILCEIISRFILTAFNSKALCAYPEEGNSLNYEIRLYNSKEAAGSPSKKDSTYIVIDSMKVKELLDLNVDLNLKIRVVNNEGSIVRKVIKALELLDNVMAKIYNNTLDNSMLLEYNDLYTSNREQKESDLLTIDDENLLKNCANEVAKNLYLVFDFKTLEEWVFVALTKIEQKQRSIKKTDVFNSAAGNKVVTYGIKSGNDYREEEISKAKGYNSEVKYRSEEIDINVLLQQIISHVSIVISTYKSFQNTDYQNIPMEILDAFCRIVTDSYKIKYEDYIEELKTKVSELRLFDSNDSSFLSTSSVQYETTDIGKNALNDLLEDIDY